MKTSLPLLAALLTLGLATYPLSASALPMPKWEYDLGNITLSGSNSFHETESAPTSGSLTFDDVWTFTIDPAASSDIKVSVNTKDSGRFSSLQAQLLDKGVVVGPPLSLTPNLSIAESNSGDIGYSSLLTSFRYVEWIGDLPAGHNYALEVMGTVKAGKTASFDGSISADPVPEPETYAMLLAGLGLLGFIARRRQPL